MMMTLINAALLTLVVPAFADVEKQTPMDTVINLLEKMRDDVTEEGREEATAYDTFACYCRDNNRDKSDELLQGARDIDKASASIVEKTAEREATIGKKEKATADRETSTTDRDNAVKAETKAQAEFDEAQADRNDAMTALDQALKSIEATRGPQLNLVEIAQSKKVVQQALALGKSLRLIDPSKQVVVDEFLQSDTAPHIDFATHTAPIVGILQDIQKELGEHSFKEETARGEARDAANGAIRALEATMKRLKGEIDGHNLKIEMLETQTADHRRDLVNFQTDMKDNKKYLEDLGALCASRANEYDQRAKMRAGELDALSKALDALQEGRKKDVRVNQRAERQVMPSALLQERSMRLKTAHAHQFLAPIPTRKERAIALLGRVGHDLGSSALLSLATRVRSDPFIKVKDLLQKLIERLIKEATDEASKKGYCDTELKKATNDRDSRMKDVNRLLALVGKLENKKDQLESANKKATALASVTKSKLDQMQKQRDADSAENRRTVKEAKEGLKAVQKAFAILKSFYKEAAKASEDSVDIAESAQLSRDMESKGADASSFKEAYQGKQAASKGIFGLLEVIKTDFERTIRETAKSEKEAQADFVEFDRASQATMSGKSKKAELTQQDTDETVTALNKGYADLQDNMNLVDGAVKQIQSLKDMCIDSGMSYEERVKKREQEIQALKDAFCLLCDEGACKTDDFCTG